MSEFRVYRNLHHSDWTVQAHGPKGWRKLVGLSALWTPHDVEFIIGEQARESVRKNKRKQVHAYAVIGGGFSLVGDVQHLPPFDISYTPYDDDGFRTVQDGGAGRYSNLSGCGGGTLFHTDGHIYSNGVRMA